jgi:hypothetical protein
MEREALKAEICTFINSQWEDGEVDLGDASHEIGEFITSLLGVEDEEDEEEDESDSDSSDSDSSDSQK